jgi:prohibitin 2
MFLMSMFLLVAIAIAAAGFIFGRGKLGVMGGIVFFVVYLAFESFTIVSAGKVGVQVTLGKVNPEVLVEGTHFVNPISDVKTIDVRLQKAELKNASAGTKDLQQVHTDIVVNFRLDPTKIPYIYKEFGFNVDEKVLGPGINEAFKSVTGHYTSEELITKRDAVSSDILAQLQAKMSPFNITVSGISLVNFGFSKAYQESIEAKVIATQNKLKAEQDLERIKVEAKARIEEAMGEAKAIQIQAQAISQQGGDNYVKLKEIEKWDGRLPETVVGSGAGMMMSLKK